MTFRVTTRGLAWAAVILTAVVVGIGAALGATSTASFCGSCKSHKPYVAAYQRSAHRDVNCEQCHSKPGPFFFLTAKLEALQQPVHQIVGNYEEPILGTVANQSCRRCHREDILFRPVSRRGIRVQHRHLIEAGFLCLRCHSTQAHDGAVPAGARTYPSMDQCLLCHNNRYRARDGRVATARCDLCHAKPGYGAVPRSHASPGWATRHGAVGILSTCSACHTDPRDCRRCHNGVSMPHAADWVTSHGAAVRTHGRAACRQCHESRRYCLTCHQVPMPHPSPFVVRHPAAARRAGTQTCFNCHRLENCQACHEAHAGGDPRAHRLLHGVPYAPTLSPAPGGGW